MTDLTKSPKNYPYITTGESEVDSLVVEEIFSSDEFQNWLLKKLSIKENAEFIAAWKNVKPTRHGECDIVIEFLINNKRTAILIEDKINAPEQPQQAERYHKTGKSLLRLKEYDEYRTCLLSPKDYYKDDAPMEKYEKRISYEEMLEFFEDQPDTERIQFKKMVLKNGIKRARKSYRQILDEKTDNFYRYYEKLAREANPELGYRYDTNTVDQSWVTIKPTIFPGNIKIFHKNVWGYVDLQISKIDIDEFRKAMEDKLGNEMHIEQTGKSLSVRIEVPPLPEIRTMEYREEEKTTCPICKGKGTVPSPEMYREDIISALNAAGELTKWYLDFKNEPIFNKTLKKESNKVNG